MGVKISVPDGNGGKILIDYAELKSKLKKQGFLESRSGVNLIRQYFPEEYKREQEAKEEAQEAETQVTLRKRWNHWFNEENKETSRRLTVIDPKNLWLHDSDVKIVNNGHEVILAKAKRAALLEYKGERRDRITDFTGWLFRLDHPSNKNSMIDGKIGERYVRYVRRLRRTPQIYDSNWALLFADDFTDTQESLICTLLLVNGAPIYGKPDYVYFNESTKTALIVEVKTSSAYLPADSWPNLRAQLWAYAHLDLIVNKAQHIILIGEVWTDCGDNRYRLRRTYHWEHSSADFYKENEALFECFQKHASL